MTQEQKDLLLKDLCARLPYGVKVEYDNQVKEIQYIEAVYNEVKLLDYKLNYNVGIEQIKPYLFPLSSMTEEQYKEWCDLEEEPLDKILTKNANGEKMSTLEHHLLIAKSLTDSINYCYKNHFDVNDLITMGLANDATGLNIY